MTNSGFLNEVLQLDREETGKMPISQGIEFLIYLRDFILFNLPTNSSINPTKILEVNCMLKTRIISVLTLLITEILQPSLSAFSLPLKSYEIKQSSKKNRFEVEKIKPITLQQAIQLGLNNHQKLPDNKVAQKAIANKLRLEITLAYYNLQEADAQVSIQQAAIESATQNLNDAKLLEQAALGTNVSVLLTEIALEQAHQRLAKAIAKQRIARRNLARVILLDAKNEVTAADEIQIAGAWNFGLEDILELAYQNYLKEYPNSSETSPDFYRVRLETETAYFNLITHQENIETTQKQIELATEVLRLSRLRFQAGVGTYTDIILATEVLTKSRINYLKSIVNYNKSLAYLRYSYY